MPAYPATGYETYIYDHRAYPGCLNDRREHRGPLHDPSKLPPPENDSDTTPLIMVEPSYASGSDDVFLFFRGGNIVTLPRFIVEQLRDALEKVCKKHRAEVAVGSLR